MPKFWVTMPIAGSVSLEVECATEEDAEDAFFEAVQIDGFDPFDPDEGVELTWDYLPVISEGNTCYASPYRMIVEKTDD